MHVRLAGRGLKKRSMECWTAGAGLRMSIVEICCFLVLVAIPNRVFGFKSS